jgi:hypothetical protein
MLNEDERQPLSQKARDILLAEALGDIHKLTILLDDANRRLAEFLHRLEIGERRDWIALLDTKMREFKNFQIPQIAAAKLQMHSETFLRGLMAEVRQLVAQEVAQDIATRAARQRLWWGLGGAVFGALTVLVLLAVI